jgi:hypothetical protein
MKPFNRGVLDFKRGHIVNPFNTGTQRYRDWEYGFNKAYYENMKGDVSAERKKASP